jgi:hypothetical protein
MHYILSPDILVSKIAQIGKFPGKPRDIRGFDSERSTRNLAPLAAAVDHRDTA